jgi:hypothetical protein
MSGVGPYAEIIARRVEVARARLGFGPEPALDCTRFQPPRGQLALL